MPKLTSIIMNCFNQNKAQVHMSMLAVQAIRQFTDQPYELIVVDNEPVFHLRNDYGRMPIDNYIIHEKDPGCYASYNIGAKAANGHYLVFIQNDVFVTEGWLPALRYYIDHNYADVVFPDQVPRTREYILESRELSFNHIDAMKGSRDAGCMMMTRESFEKTGGWDERIKAAIIGEALFYDRIVRANLRMLSTRKAVILHIAAGTNLAKPSKQYYQQMDEEAKIMQKESKIMDEEANEKKAINSRA